jgi:hypothetical protein
MKTTTRIAVMFTLLLAGGLAALGSWIDHFGPVAEGQVVAKHERVVFISSDQWKHELIVRYRYQPDGAQTFEQGWHRVDAALFDRLAPGAPVAVRYHPWGAVRSRVGLGSGLAGTNWWSRSAPLRSSSPVATLDAAMIVLAGLAVWAACMWRARAIALLAGVLVSTVVYGILLLGAFVWPTWLLLWWRARSSGFAWGLVLSVVLGTIMLAVRFPWPAPAATPELLEANGVIVQSHKGDTLWTKGRRRSDRLVEPFVLVDVEYTPRGADRPMHAVDRVDHPGDRRYAKGAPVRVEYSPNAPRDARLANATRDFVSHSFTHFLLVWTLGGGIVVLLLAWAGLRIKQAVSRRLPRSRADWSDLFQGREFNPRQTKGD